MVLSGGVSLGAYQGGVYERLHEHFGEHLHWVAGSSIGAVNGAIIAGNEPHRRVERLSQFWEELASILPPPLVESGPSRRAYNWSSALRTRALGRPQLFSVRPPHLLAASDAAGLYDLSPMADTLERFVCFDRLNDAPVRMSVVTTDLETGEAVVFDTGKGDRIEPHQILASCGFLPDFQPIEIGGRLLGDGALVANAPVDVVLGPDAPDDDLICFVVDLFARNANRPTSLEGAAERRLDLLLANQSYAKLEALRRELRLRHLLARAGDLLPSRIRNRPEIAPMLVEGRRSSVEVVHLSYRPAPEEAGPEKQFDFSRATLADRWEAGARDAARAMQVLESAAEPDSGGLRIHRVGTEPCEP